MPLETNRSKMEQLVQVFLDPSSARTLTLRNEKGGYREKGSGAEEVGGCRGAMGIRSGSC